MKKRIVPGSVIIMIFALVIVLGGDRVFAQSEESLVLDQNPEVNRLEFEKFHLSFYTIREWPVPEHTRISSAYGYRIHPIERRIKMHIGVDIPAPEGTPIVAVESGIVTVSRSGKSYGKWIEIDHGDEITTRYAHNVQNLVKVDDWVEKGEIIGLVGNTGNSTGNHLHFEVRFNNNHFDPLPWLLETEAIYYYFSFHRDKIGIDKK